MKYVVFALTLAVLMLGGLTVLQQRAINTILRDQKKSLNVELSLSLQVQRLQRKVDDMHKELADLNRRHDLVTAATRMGWAQAYRLLRAGVLTEPTEERTSNE